MHRNATEFVAFVKFRQIRPPVGNNTLEESIGQFAFDLGIEKNLLKKNKEGERWTCSQTHGVSSTRALEPTRELCACSRRAAALRLEGLRQKTMFFTTIEKCKSLHSSEDTVISGKNYELQYLGQ